MPEATERGVLAAHRARVVGVVLAHPAVLLEDVELVLGVLGLAAVLVPPVGEVDVGRDVRPVAVEVLLARERGAPGRDAAGAVAERPVRAGADARCAAERPGELEVRPVAVDPAVVGRRRDDLPFAVAPALDVEDRVADVVLLLLHLRRGLGAAVRLVAVQVERVRVLVVDEQQPLVLALEREEGEEVVVEAVAVRAPALAAEDVAPRDEDVGAESAWHLQRVGRARSDRPEVAEGVVASAVAERRVGEQVDHAGALERDRARRAGAGCGDAADEVAPCPARQFAGKRLIGVRPHGSPSVGDPTVIPRQVAHGERFVKYRRRMLAAVMSLLALAAPIADPLPTTLPHYQGAPATARPLESQQGSAEPAPGQGPAQQHPQRHVDDRRVPLRRAAREQPAGVLERDDAGAVRLADLPLAGLHRQRLPVGRAPAAGSRDRPGQPRGARHL